MAVSEEGASVGSFAVVAYADVRLGVLLQRVPHAGQIVGDVIGDKASGLLGDVLYGKHALQVVAFAMARARSSVEVHHVGRSHRNSCSLDYVELDCDIGDVLGSEAGGRLDLYEVESGLVIPIEDVNPDPDSLERERGLVEWRDGVAGQQCLCRFDRVGMLVVWLVDQSAAGESLAGQLADGVAGIEDPLAARVYGVRELAVVAFQVESLQALEAGEESGLG